MIWHTLRRSQLAPEERPLFCRKEEREDAPKDKELLRIDKIMPLVVFLFSKHLLIDIVYM